MLTLAAEMPARSLTLDREIPQIRASQTAETDYQALRVFCPTKAVTDCLATAASAAKAPRKHHRSAPQRPSAKCHFGCSQMKGYAGGEAYRERCPLLTQTVRVAGLWVWLLCRLHRARALRTRKLCFRLCGRWGVLGVVVCSTRCGPRYRGLGLRA